MGGLRNRTFDLVFTLLVMAAGATLLAFGHGLTFFFDDWLLILAPDPLSPGQLLDAHNGQAFMIPSLTYGVLLNVFGMTSQLPFRVVNVLAASACVVLLFVFTRRRTSPGLALVLVLPVLVLGIAWEALLLSLSMNFTIGLACGLGMFLALERDDRTGERLACGLLVASLACGGIGLAFLAGAIADTVLRRDPTRWWIPALPLLLFVLWLPLAGEQTDTDYLENILGLPGYLYDAAIAAVRTITGISSGHVTGEAVRVLPPLALLGLIIAILIRVVLVRAPVPKQALVVAAVLLSFWVLGGLAMNEGRGPEAGRYQYPAAVLLIAFAACLLDGLDPPRWLPLAILPFALFSVTSNVQGLQDGRQFLLQQSEITRSSIGSLELFGQGIEDLVLTREATGSPFQQTIVSGPYFRAASKHGTPAYSRDQIEDSGEAGRKAAAGVAMAAALRRSGR